MDLYAHSKSFVEDRWIQPRSVKLHHYEIAASGMRHDRIVYINHNFVKISFTAVELFLQPPLISCDSRL